MAPQIVLLFLERGFRISGATIAEPEALRSIRF
jgi:hypothetical protein